MILYTYFLFGYFVSSVLKKNNINSNRYKLRHFEEAARVTLPMARPSEAATEKPPDLSGKRKN